MTWYLPIDSVRTESIGGERFYKVSSRNLARPAPVNDAEKVRAIDRGWRTHSHVLALLGELDKRKVFLGEGCSSLFTYCTQRLRMSEPHITQRA